MKLFEVILLMISVFSSLLYADIVQLDSAFGSSKNGMMTQPFNNQAYGSTVAVQPDGKILVFGTANNGTDYIVGVRYTTAGQLDTTFGIQGIVETFINNGLIAHDIVLQPDGKVIVLGASIVNVNPGFMLARYNADGSLDTSWGYGGIAWCTVYGVAEAAVLSNGLPVSVATTSGASQLVAAIARQDSTGFPDMNFGTIHGATILQAGDSTRGHDIALQSTGKIVIVGDTNNNGQKLFIARFTSNGVLDETFANNGVKILLPPGTQSAKATGVAVQSDNAIIVTGSADDNVIVVRLTVDGQLDTSFGAQGYVTTQLDATAITNAIVLQPDGKFVVTGSDDNHMFVARYTSTGLLDTTFGNGGIAKNVVGSKSDAHYLALQADGKIVITGETDNQFFTARYRADNTDFVAITSPASGATITSNTFPINGYASQSGLLINLILDNSVIGNVTTDSFGNWNTDSSPVVANGQHNLSAQLLNVNKQTLGSVTNAFTVNAGDTIVIDQPQPGVVINTNKPLITGQSSRTGALVLLMLDGVAWTSAITDAIGNWQATLAAIPNGSHVLVALLLENGTTVITQASVAFTSAEYLCNNLRILNGLFTTGNPPIINAGSGSSCPPTCDFSVQKINHNVFNITYGFPFSYSPIVTADAEKIRSNFDGFVTIVEGGTVGYVIVELHGRASQIHFTCSSCRG